MKLILEFESYSEAETLLPKVRELFPQQLGGRSVPAQEAQPAQTTVEAPQPAVEAATSPAAPVAAPAVSQPMPQPAVPTAPAPVFSRDDLAKACVSLMDNKRTDELRQLLSRFGVASLPELPDEQIGPFATALRGMGAAI